jgi:hypothetical protein
MRAGAPPRARFPPSTFRRRALAACALALLCAAGRAGADDQPAADEPAPADLAAALAAIAPVRAAIDPNAEPTVPSGRLFPHRDRPSLEIKGRAVPAAGGDAAAGEVREYAVFDLAARRLVSYVYFPHASARRTGEAILSLGSISTRADAAVHALLPGRELVLDGIQRYRASGQESVYYEARYAPTGGELTFLVPPVRMLLDASTGRVFRFEQDPEWPTPVAPPRSMISRGAAARIAAVVLDARDLSATFGPGAARGPLGVPELFVVQPNGWLGVEPVEPGARAAWVVPFRLAGEAQGVQHQLFVDAATGRVIGGLAGGDAPR